MHELGNHSLIDARSITVGVSVDAGSGMGGGRFAWCVRAWWWCLH